MSFLDELGTSVIWNRISGLFDNSYNTPEDSGWKNFSFYSGDQDVTFGKYTSNSICRYRKIGNTVLCHGIITIDVMNVPDPNGTALNQITTLPASIGTLDRTIYQICQGSFRHIWLLTIQPVSGGGAILNASRYGGTTNDWWVDYTDANKPWMPFYIEFTTK